MIIFAPTVERCVVIVRVAGNLGTSTFGALSRRLAAKYEGIPLRVFLDWTELREWKADGELRRACERWDEVSRKIECAAIIHRPCWNRQAALLAAVLRRNGCIVRSWPLEKIDAAFQWLSEREQEVRPGDARSRRVENVPY